MTQHTPSCTVKAICTTMFVAAIGSGCILPREFEAQPLPKTRPTVLREETQPPLDDRLVVADSTPGNIVTTTFRVRVNEPDVADSLFLRAFLNADYTDPREIAPHVQEVEEKLYDIEFEVRRLCGAGGSSGSGNILEAYVADNPFIDNGPDRRATSEGRGWDNVFWWINCVALPDASQEELP